MKYIIASILALSLLSCDKFSITKQGASMNSVSPCKNLHKVTSRDDLLKQLYETTFLDDCLYSMSNEELEKIWGVPVRDLDIMYAEEYVNSPFEFYVLKFNDLGNSEIIVKLTKNQQDSGNHMLFPGGEFPTFLGEPKKFEMTQDMREGQYPTNYIAKSNDQIQDGYMYYWLHCCSNRIISTETYPVGAVAGIGFSQNNTTEFLK